jgi:CRISPR-associated protein Cmr5
MQTRSQQYSQIAYGHIFPLKEAKDNEQDNEEKEKKQKTAKQYGSLCHNFPLMVLRSGLSQAIAFVWVKSKGDANTAYGQFLTHLSNLTGLNDNLLEFQKEINQAELIKYQRLSRKILAASIWYKRFAESVLGITAGEDVEGDNDA